MRVHTSCAVRTSSDNRVSPPDMASAPAKVGSPAFPPPITPHEGPRALPPPPASAVFPDSLREVMPLPSEARPPTGLVDESGGDAAVVAAGSVELVSAAISGGSGVGVGVGVGGPRGEGGGRGGGDGEGSMGCSVGCGAVDSDRPPAAAGGGLIATGMARPGDTGECERARGR